MSAKHCERINPMNGLLEAVASLAVMPFQAERLRRGTCRAHPFAIGKANLEPPWKPNRMVMVNRAEPNPNAARSHGPMAIDL